MAVAQHPGPPACSASGHTPHVRRSGHEHRSQARAATKGVVMPCTVPPASSSRRPASMPALREFSNAWQRTQAYSTAETSQEHTGAMDMRRVRVGCEFVYVAAVDTPAVFQIEPRHAAP